MCSIVFVPEGLTRAISSPCNTDIRRVPLGGCWRTESANTYTVMQSCSAYHNHATKPITEKLNNGSVQARKLHAVESAGEKVYKNNQGNPQTKIMV